MKQTMEQEDDGMDNSSAAPADDSQSQGQGLSKLKNFLQGYNKGSKEASGQADKGQMPSMPSPTTTFTPVAPIAMPQGIAVAPQATPQMPMLQGNPVVMPQPQFTGINQALQNRYS